MARPAWTISAATMILLFVSAVASAEPPPGSGDRRSGKKPARQVTKGTRALEEVRIVGSAEHPDVLFFLPRTRFRLLPPRGDRDWRETVLIDDKTKGIAPE